MQDKLKWISQFKPCVIKEIELLTYDDYIYDKDNSLMGHLPKSFYRAPSSKMSELFTELKKNPECSFITYINDVAKEGMVPEHVSVLSKSCGGYIYYPEREAVISKLLNYMGVPTTFNMVAKSVKINDRIPTSECEVLSVDCIGANEIFYALNELGFELSSIQNPCVAIDNIKKSLLKFKFNNDMERKEYIQKIINDFLLTYMIRGYLLGDNDFRTRNLGLLYNAKNKSVKFVNFDFEQCLMADIVGLFEKYSYLEEPVFLFVKSQYPKIYERFINYVEEFKGKLSGLTEGMLMTKFNKNFSQIMAILRDNAEAISNYNEKLDNKIKGKLAEESINLLDPTNLELIQSGQLLIKYGEL